MSSLIDPRESVEVVPNIHFSPEEISQAHELSELINAIHKYTSDSTDNEVRYIAEIVDNYDLQTALTQLPLWATSSSSVRQRLDQTLAIFEPVPEEDPKSKGKGILRSQSQSCTTSKPSQQQKKTTAQRPTKPRTDWQAY